jgi:hypothetical protein
VLGTGNIILRRAMIKAPRKKFLVQAHNFARFNRFILEFFPLFIGAVDPQDLVRLAHAGHFQDPGV